jgi:hypothetical protein
VQQEKVVSAT